MITIAADINGQQAQQTADRIRSTGQEAKAITMKLIDKRLDSQKMTSPAEAARILLQGVDRNQAFIVFPGLMKTLWAVYRLAPGIFEKTILKKYTAEYRKMKLSTGR